jgi:hypothetical protein
MDTNGARRSATARFLVVAADSRFAAMTLMERIVRVRGPNAVPFNRNWYDVLKCWPAEMLNC